MDWVELCSQIIVPTPIQFLYEINGVQIFIKRDDLNHESISGNKWRKLKYNLKEYEASHFEGIISFGGAYSNHIFSLSAACHLLNIPLIVIVRGKDANEANSTLHVLTQRNQTIIKVDRSVYRQKLESQEIQDILYHYKNFMVLPEGGTNVHALLGVGEVVDELRLQDVLFDYLVCSMGTGGTAAGLLQKLNAEEKLVVYPALKGSWIKSEIVHLAQQSEKLPNLV
ncbi:MAG TPA: pyridoxal-phosphate dependent enzyme, partial [Saprospiraceae bacterium]|nr:pyridoxal-phosphate dependent enzyme [Saprospiraceae bacterium]